MSVEMLEREELFVYLVRVGTRDFQSRVLPMKLKKPLRMMEK